MQWRRGLIRVAWGLLGLLLAAPVVAAAPAARADAGPSPLGAVLSALLFIFGLSGTIFFKKGPFIRKVRYLGADLTFASVGFDLAALSGRAGVQRPVLGVAGDAAILEVMLVGTLTLWILALGFANMEVDEQTPRWPAWIVSWAIGAFTYPAHIVIYYI